MKIKVTGEAVFQVNAHIFGITPSNEGYTLNYSDDGVHFTEHDEPTEAGKTETVVNAPIGRYYKLVGNASSVQITF